MQRISWFWAAIGLLITIIFFISWQMFGKLTPSADILTEHDARNLVKERYQGKVGQIKFTDQQYHIELEKQNHIYIIKIDAETGKVMGFTETGSVTQNPSSSHKVTLSEEEIRNIVLAEVNGTITSIDEIQNNQEHYYTVIVMGTETQTTMAIDAESGNILSSNSSPISVPPKSLTESEVIQIALAQVQGDVDDVWIETKSDISYYLVKIETNDDREAIVEVHSITGEVTSVSWDDRNKNDDDDVNERDDD